MKQILYQESLPGLDDIELDKVSLNISTVVSEIVYQIPVATSQRPLGIFLRKKQDMTRFKTMA